MTIKSNTTDLQSILDAVNALPEASEAEAVEQATPSITVSSSGIITATATQEAGLVEAGTKMARKQLTTQAAKTVIPTTSNQTAVAALRYTTGAVTVKGDANLVPANIAEGVSIFGVEGTHSGGSGGGGGASLDTCTIKGSFSEWGFEVYATVVSNGVVTHEAFTQVDTIENVLCGSIFTIYSSWNEYAYGYDVSNGEFLVGSGYDGYVAPVFSAPTEAGSVCTITFMA